MKFNSRYLLLALTATGLSCQLAWASTNQAVSLTGNVIGDCSTLSPSGTQAFGFGSYDSGAGTSSGPLTFQINCTRGDANLNVQINGGQNYAHASPSGNRAMSDGSAHYLSYQLYQDASTSSSPWSFNSTTGIGQQVTETAGGIGAATTFKVWGFIPQGQTDLPVATYNDQVQVAVNY